METRAIGAASAGAGAPAVARPLARAPAAIVYPERRCGGAAALGDGVTLDAASAGVAGEAAALTRGDAVDRYVILARLGQGGMGVVFAAYDPKLDRKVALKLLPPAGGRGAGHGDARAGLLREAQALARLAHPAVVAVHDVGTVGQQVWLAMEFVDGVTLARWLKAKRPWREVLAVFRRAGEGLAAAHAAGLVHRDFKPDNVMVGADGRVRVMDFGLARADAAGAETAAQGSTSALRRDETAVGAVMGTLAYMAPEQWLGGSTDARTDQFAFCVALWEGLYGARPFAGEDRASLAHRVTTGRRQEPPRRRVPSWLRRTVERGLAPTPGRRWPSMAALLAALASGAGRRRRRWLLGGAALLAAAVGAGLAGRSWEHAERVAACEQQGGSIAEAWNGATRAETREALLASGAPFADTTVGRLVPRLDEYAAQWAAARGEACMRTQVERAWDAEQATRADECLAEARWALEDLVAALVAADAGVAARAVLAAAALPPLAPCLDAESLARRPRPPQDEAARAEAAALVRALAQVRTLMALGRDTEGLVRARQLDARAGALGWTPLSARVRALAGRLAERAGERHEAETLLEEGLYLALAAGEEALAVEAAALLTYTVGDRLGRTDEGLRWGRLGEALLPRLGPAARAAEVDLYCQIGNVEGLRGEYAAAERHYELALAGVEAIHGPAHPEPAVAPGDLAAGPGALRLAHARFTLARALWASEAERGRAHALAQQAARGLRAATPTPAALADVDAWLAGHPAP
ncbi:MAG: serine/threonine protein kinase [Myxococcales bacterium]|nr:serine/threonine protein kinase [Myxococcales bacterium]